MSRQGLENRRTKTDAEVVFSGSSGAGVGAAIDDLWRGFLAHDIWIAFAWEETKRRFRRSVFGLSWIALSYALFVGAISLFFGGLTNKNPSYFVTYVASGYAAFTFISAAIQDGSTVFTSSAKWIKSVRIPYSIYIYKSIVRALLPFCIQMGVFFVIAFVMGHKFQPMALLTLLTIPVFIINAIGMQIILGYLTVRFRDIEHLIAAVLRVLFFVTPILWLYSDMTGIRKIIANLNPVTHFIEIFRAPLLGEYASVLNWTGVGLTTAFIWIFAIIVSAALRRRLPFWV